MFYAELRSGDRWCVNTFAEKPQIQKDNTTGEMRRKSVNGLGEVIRFLGYDGHGNAVYFEEVATEDRGKNLDELRAIYGPDRPMQDDAETSFSGCADDIEDDGFVTCSFTSIGVPA